MDENNELPQEQARQGSALSPMKLGVIIYLAGLIFLYISISYLPGSVTLFGYLAIGFALNRIVLRQLEWHHMHNTLSNVASAKLTSFLFWPLSYLFLFVSMLINRVL